MIKLKNSSKLFLNIVIVVAGIIVFTLLDPFGIFSKRNLRDTANLVSSVKNIGELVTAEYYGEVISSLNETFVFDIPEDTVTHKFEECLYTLKSICNEAINSKKKKLNWFLGSGELKNLQNEFGPDSGNIYNHLIVLLGVSIINSDEAKFYKKSDEGLKDGAERRVIKRIFNKIEEINKKQSKNKITDEEWKEEIEEYINDIPEYLDGSANFHYQLNDMALNKRERRHDIVFIGRGWVKAGYRFELLDERNFTYHKSSKLIRFYGLAPVILDKDINPWFVPENKIKGFELVDFYSGATFEEAKIVKKRCKEKLLDQAYRAGILDQAQEYGEEALKNFFSLLLDEPDLEVEFLPLPNQKELNMIAADTLITVDEAFLIESILQLYKDTIGRSQSADKEMYQQQVQIFYNQLTELPFIESNNLFNIFSIEAAKLLKDKYYILKADYDCFTREVRDTLRIRQLDGSDAIYTHFTDKYPVQIDYPEFVEQFNSTMKLLDRQLSLAIGDTEITVEITQPRLDSLVGKMDTIIDGIIIDTITNKLLDGNKLYIIKRKSIALPYWFTDLSYPKFSLSDSFSDTLNLSDLDSLERYIERFIERPDSTKVYSKIDSLRKSEMDTIRIYEHNRIERKITLKPIHKFIDVVKKPFN